MTWPSMHIILDGDGAWPDLEDRKNVVNARNIAALAVLGGGMASGRPSIALRIELPDGTTVIVETSARLFCTAARAIMAKYPNLFEDD